jgi:hypothetical protein
MKTVEPHLRKTLELITDEIKIRQDELGQLIQARTTLCELAEIPAELPIAPDKKPRGKKAKPTPSPRTPSATAIQADDGEPQSLGAAMKKVARAENKFTSDALRQIVSEKYKSLYKEVGAGAFGANLKYWTQTGKLTLAGDVYTVSGL